MNKKVFIIGAGIIILIIIIVLIKYGKQILSNRQTEKISINKVINNKVLFPTITSNQNKIIFLNTENENYFYELNLNTLQKNIISKPLNVVPNSVLWSPTKENAILEIYYYENSNSIFKSTSTDSNTITYWVYNLKNNSAKQLSGEILGFCWSPDGNKIVYAYYDPIGETDALDLLDKSGKFIKRIAKIDYDEWINLGFIDPTNFYYSPVLSEAGGTNIYNFNINTGDIKPIFENNSVASSLIITPNKEKIIYAFYKNSEGKYFIGTMDLNGDNKKTFTSEIDINRTAVFPNNQFVITAISQKKNQNYDDFYKINIETGEKTLLFKSSNKEHYSASNLMLSEDGKTLYFTSDDYLYKLDLE